MAGDSPKSYLIPVLDTRLALTSTLELGSRLHYGGLIRGKRGSHLADGPSGSALLFYLYHTPIPTNMR